MLNNFTEMLQEKIALLNEKEPLILLDAMEHKTIYFLQELLKDNDSVKMFVIEKNNKIRPFLKLHKDSLEDYENDTLIMGQVHSLFAKKHYKQVQEKLLNLICVLQNPHSCYYRMLAFTYMYLGEKEKAIDTFLIAEGVSKRTKNKYKFNNLIKKLSIN